MKRNKIKISVFLLTVVLLFFGSTNKDFLLFTRQDNKLNQENDKNDKVYDIVQEQKDIYTSENIMEDSLLFSDEVSDSSQDKIAEGNSSDRSIMVLNPKCDSIVLAAMIQKDTINNESIATGEAATWLYAAAKTDEMVEAAQEWYNSNYAGKSGLEKIEVTGHTGHSIVNALISALQVELGITEPTGTFGPLTMKLCPTFSISSPLANKNITKILQYGLYCKGYSAGTVDGSFNSKTLDSIIKLQKDAGLVGNGQVTPMIFKAVLSTDALTLVYGGDPQIRAIQQYLNGNYYDYIGVKPCDGIYSRDTNKALIYALQKEEGLSVEESSGSFRDYTTNNCPTVKKGEKNSKIVRILQFGLYFNGYNPGNFDGNYTDSVAIAVESFNKFMCLSGNGNSANVTTIKGLLTSCGDTDDVRRPGNACDTASILTKEKVSRIKEKGYKYVGRYLSGTVTNASGNKVSKALTKDEATLILSNGLSIIPIYQEGYPEKDRYTAEKATTDAYNAVSHAYALGLPKGSTIYFAVDYDVQAADISSNIKPYFKALCSRVKAFGDLYKVGIYAPREVCTILADAGYTKSSYVSDMSTGYCYNMGFRMPSNWAFDQIAEDTNLNLDKVIASGRDEAVTYLSYNESKPCNEATVITSEEDYYKGDPVNIATGAHNINYSAVTIYGEQELELQLQYSSDSLAKGSMGIGWYYNYEMSIKKTEEGCQLYLNPSNYIIYTKKTDSESEYICNVSGRKNDVLTLNNDGSYTVNCNNETIYNFDKTGRLISETDKSGFGLHISYEAQTIKITENISGKSIVLTKNQNGLVTEITDNAGNICHLMYDKNNCLSSITDGVGNTTSYTYDAVGRVLTGTDADGICYFRDEYDGFGRVICQYDGISGSSPTRFGYDDSPENGDTVVTVTDRNGNKSISIFNCSRQLMEKTDANGNKDSYEYDANGNIISSTDALGNQAEYSYNDNGKILSETDNNGAVTEYEYDTNNNLIRKIYPNGASETYVYDISGKQMLSSVDINGQITDYEYYDNGLLRKKVVDDSEYQYTYENGLLKTATSPNGGVMTYTYDASGRAAKITDANSNILRKSYDAIGQLIKVTNADNSVLTYTYDGRGQAKTFCDANGNLTKYSYNANGMLVSKENSEGAAIRYEYDGEDKLVKTTDRNGNISTITYDAAGQIISQTYPNGGTVKFEYDEVGNLIKKTEASGSYIIRTYDANGNVLTEMDADGVKSEYVYDSMSYVIKAYNTKGYKTDYELNNSGQVLQSKDSMGNVIKNEYDTNGNIVRTTDANGNHTSYEYDSCQNLIKITDSNNNETTFTYDKCMNRTSSTDANGNTYTYFYDSCGRCIKITDPLGNSKTTDYDKNGNIIKTTNFAGNIVAQNTYDFDNNMVKSVDTLGNTIHVSYDANGNITESTDAKGNKTTYEYNGMNQMTKSVNPLLKASEISYDADGRVITTKGPLGASESYEYSNAGRLISEQTATDSKVKYGYGEDGLLSEKTNARGQKMSYTYNSIENVTSITANEGTTRYEYDANGNIVKISDSKSTIEKTYDSDNRVTTYTNNQKNVAYEYDAVGNIISLTYPDGTKVQYTYDSLNQMISVKDWNNHITSYEYDANGNITKMTRPDGSILTKKYDAADNLIEALDIRANGTVISKFAYSYDANGNIISETSYAENVKYEMTYDSMDRVISRKKLDLSSMAVLDTENFTYDDACNITSSTKQNSTISMTYDIRNRLKTVSGSECTYDADGNMTLGLVNGALKNLKYDSGNRLISAGDISYIYDTENIRIAKEDTTGKTSYVYGSMWQSSILLESIASNGSTTKYVYGAGALISQESTDGTVYYHYDLRGSTVALTNETGIITDTYRYDVYGMVTHLTGDNKTPFLYNGRDGVMTDGNGLLYMRARYYSPELKRFVNADILTGNIGESDSLNRYAYVDGNPITMVDPFGLCKEPGSKKNNSGGLSGKIKSMWSKGKGKASEIKNGTKKYFSKWKPADYIHTALDGLGMAPGCGIIFDGSNAIYYLAEEEFLNAGLSGVSLIPLVGEVSATGKLSYKTVKIANGISEAIVVLKAAKKIEKDIQNNSKSGYDIADAGASADDAVDNVEEGDSGAEEDAKKPTSQNQLQKQVEKGQAPKGVDRVDPADSNVPESQPHVHFGENEAALNQDGTWHDAGKAHPKITNKIEQWLTQNGWKVPTE